MTEQLKAAAYDVFAHGPKDGSMTIGDGVDGRPYVSDPIKERIAMPEPSAAAVKTAYSLVKDERARQRERWGDEHDDHHKDGQLYQGALAYLFAREDGSTAAWWPWSPDTFKPGSRERNLVKAAAMLTAESERLARIGGVTERMIAARIITIEHAIRQELNDLIGYSNGDGCGH